MFKENGGKGGQTAKRQLQFDTRSFYCHRNILVFPFEALIAEDVY